MHRHAHRLSSSFISALGLTVLLCAAMVPAFAADAPSKKQAAYLQYEKAEQLRESLNGRPQAERTRRDYQHVIDAYRRVYYTSPASSKADESIRAVAELLAAMGRQFPPDEKDLHAAIGQYQFLRREYPGSKYRMEALFAIGQIYKDDLDDPDAAKSAFAEFLHRYPHDERAPKARDELAELDRPKPKKEETEEVHAVTAPTPSAETQPEKAEAVPVSVAKRQTLELVTGIRHWSSPDSTRVAIDVDGPVEYQVGRVPNPDRIFFDLPNTRLTSTLVGKSFDVEDGYLKKIRVAQYQRDSIRVVLEVQNLSEYSAFVLPNPYRLIIDVHGRKTNTSTEVASNSPAPATENLEDSDKPGNGSRSILSGNVAAGEEGKPVSRAKTGSEEAGETAFGNAQRDQIENHPAASSKKGSSAATTSGSEHRGTKATAAPQPVKSANSGGGKSADTKLASGVSDTREESDELLNASDGNKSAEIRATTHPTSAPTAVAVTPRDKSAKKGAKSANSLNVVAHEAAPTSDGDRSLIRALGLKIGRIVIDAGHGGHDTGTIGPDGLMEKDLVLDVSLRLGRLLESRLGADVIYTRDDDTFIPLETRTAIANEKQADLFISVHANSSPDPAARGVETYYLNFTSDPGALEVAARENAVSQKSIHELQDLVKKIALKDKIEESHELAADVQQSLYAGIGAKNSSVRNRGVKKAPFVVLIGANMPSILVEISFLSNPTDEEHLETPEYRQKIAESLYKGIAKYVGGLSGVKVAKMTKEAGE